MGLPLSARTYVTRETAIGIVINAVLSASVFVAAFGNRQADVPVWGSGGLAWDFVPQCLAISFMSTALPGWLAIRARRSGKVRTAAGEPRISGRLAVRIAVASVVGTACGSALGVLGLLALNSAAVPWSSALVAKVAFGAALGGLVIAMTLPDALSEPEFGTA